MFTSPKFHQHSISISFYPRIWLRNVCDRLLSYLFRMELFANEKCSLQRGIRNYSNICPTEGLQNFASHKPWEKYVRTDEWFDTQERQWTTNIGPIWLQEKFTDTRKKSQSNQPSKNLRSSVDNAFNWKQHCLICAKAVDTRHTNKFNIIKVMNLPLRDNLVVCAKEKMMIGENLC